MAVPLLHSLHAGLDSWFTRKTSQLADDPLEPLPRERALALGRRIEALDGPAPLQAFVREALGEAIEAWRADPEAANVLVVLGRPVEPITPVIEAVLAEREGPSSGFHTLLPCHRRPADPENTPRMLTAALEGRGASGAAEGEASLLSLPNLDQCFLRCIDGWSGIERLRRVILERRDSFWLLGCSSWAWKFLDHVSQISSYFPAARFLPSLEGSELREWLAPVAEGLELKPETAAVPGGPETAEDAAADRWSQLAELAAGSSRIAAELWLGSLRLAPADDEGGLRQVKPVLPDLPSLTDEDRYLLHSLLIHSTMRRDHLAFGLGLPSHRLQPRIHWLLGEGVIEETAGELAVRPSHYPCLVKELANNNFFTWEA
ncbi:hypothetical protein [Synechococcus sp. CCY 9618]|uniref:hypothetical protein n=1 Tax=Synechococcus sp. CCY 9618 TaxID=2815602 RepID=UPI001C24EA8A|nr:hypothetical protein [Synechococcus sp. CCY 9618]